MKFKSSELRIYPAANRNASYDYFANLNVEQNITMLSNNLTDYHSYVVNGLDLQVEDIKENSETKKYLTLTSGKCVINGYNIEIKAVKNIKIQELDTSSDYTYKVYLKLNCVESAVSQGNTMTQLVGYDDENTELYTGIDIIVADAHTDLPDNILYLGIVTHTGSLWYIQLLSKEKKFSANNTYIELPFDSGLVGNSNNTDFKGTFINWLENNFIIDDDDISSSRTVSSPAIKIEYLDGSSIQLDVQKLHFGTTLTADMIPSISRIESLFIPDYFTQVQEGTLNGASNLVTLSLPFTGLNNDPLNTSDGLFGRIFGNIAYQNSITVSQTSDVLAISRFNCEIPQSLTNITIRNKVSPFAFASIGNIGKEYNILTNLDISTVSDFNSNYTFTTFQGLKNIILPFKLTNIGKCAFNRCINLTRIDLLSNITYIDEYAFSQSTQLSTIAINTNALVILQNTNAFNNTLITANTGHIYVPSTLVAAYKADPTWAYFSDIIESI